MILTTEFYDYGDRTVTINRWEPIGNENACCPACDRELYIDSDGEVHGYKGKHGFTYCEALCEENHLGEECQCCGDTRYLNEQRFCATCITVCQVGRCRSLLGNTNNPSQDPYFGVLREKDGQLLPVCMDCIAGVSL